MDIEKYIRTVPDWPKKGILFRDITTLLKNYRVFKFTVDRLATFAKKCGADSIAAIEARGFIFGAPVALKLGIPFVPLRKKGKLPWKTYTYRFKLEYGWDEIQSHRDAFKRGSRVFIIDDVLATGGTAKAAAKLVEKCGAKIAGMGFLLELGSLKGRSKLDGYKVNSIKIV